VLSGPARHVLELFDELIEADQNLIAPLFESANFPAELATVDGRIGRAFSGHSAHMLASLVP